MVTCGERRCQDLLIPEKPPCPENPSDFPQCDPAIHAGMTSWLEVSYIQLTLNSNNGVNVLLLSDLFLLVL